jgi:ribosomal protein L11 methylase PrmA
MSSTTKHPGSFRDPAGHILVGEKGEIYREVMQAGREDYDGLMQSGLYDDLVAHGLLVPHKEVAARTDNKDVYKTIRPEQIPFITYPYEWSYSQLKDAALLTLEIQKRALAHNMILKDASAYNVQFIGKKPVFIDTLSFKSYTPGAPWEGYRQFCEHFLAPLALASYTSLDSLKMLRVDLEGISLELATKLLPKRAKMRAGLLSHLYLHNASQKKYQNIASDKQTKEVQTRKVSTFALQGIIGSLERSVRTLKAPKQQTEWGEYYTFTNYSDKSFARKRKLVKELLELAKPGPKVVWDIGANNGEFSILAAEKGIYTVACDIDPNAVERNYRTRSKDGSDDVVMRNMLPVVQDVVNPSPATGFMGRERESFAQRGPADLVMALAVVHHLAIGRNLPLERIAEFLASVGRQVIIEFVPKGDSKVDILLASRRDIFSDYTEEQFEKAMGTYFKQVEKRPIQGTKRTLYLYKIK